MSTSDAPSGVFADGRRALSAGRPCPELSACAPVPGPRRRPVAGVAVDDDLVWVLPIPAVEPGATRAPTPAVLVHLCVQLAQDLAAANGAARESAFCDAELVDAAARAVAGYLDDLPDLPFVGEPFGGEEGTD